MRITPDNIDVDILTSKWKEIYKIYINFLKNGEVEQNDRSALLSYSADCSDIYGDAIHLARAMANTFDTTYFDAYDDCLQESEPRSSKASDQKISVYPNPSNGKFYFKLPPTYLGQAIIYDVLGNKIEQIIISTNNKQEIDLSTKNGIYFIRFISIDGHEETHRVIVIN